MVEVPIQLVPDEDDPRLVLPFVQVEVDGVVVEVLLDSGAARTQLVDRPQFTRATGTARHSDSAGAFGSHTSDAASAVVSCRLGCVDVGPLDVAVVRGEGPGHSDVLGQDVLGTFRCGYRLADGVLELDPEMPPHSHDIDLGERGHVYLDLMWGADHCAAAVFDTGASVTVVDQTYAGDHPDLFAPCGTSTGTDASGATVDTPMAVMRGPKILGAKFDDALVALVDLAAANSTLQRPMDMVLGWTLSSQADWVIDHSHARAACAVRSSD